MSTRVEFHPKAFKALRSLPDHIVAKLKTWVTAVELLGLREIRKRPGFHDEPLQGNRKGQRSVRLNRAYRAIYVQTADGDIELVEILEVSKHEY